MDNKKLLSALYDGELTEVEEHQLLRQADVASSSKDWMFWQEIRLAGKAIEAERRLSPKQHQLLYERVQQAIAGEAQLAVEPAFGFRHRLQRNLVGIRSKVASNVLPLGAMAAMLALAVSLVNLNPAQNGPVTTPGVVQGIVQNDTNREYNSSTPGSENVTLAGTLPSGMMATNAGAAGPELKALDEESQQRLRAYLYEHDRMNQLPGNSRFVKYPSTISK
ncbi:MAG: hypothetical protein HOL98_11240 [Gammaproteobacteria bacterium]|jgi:negative regulator of sigma E activity|nr:hypothetical protein [Gammaproteobacteria bacterium]MBT5603797.1 hypothetical protein [Gammaproteobacteria bacterium]MBT6243840.1 hypothetical protein [Gammaproteobacteria bacterium]